MKMLGSAICLATMRRILLLSKWKKLRQKSRRGKKRNRRLWTKKSRNQTTLINQVKSRKLKKLKKRRKKKYPKRTS